MNVYYLLPLLLVALVFIQSPDAFAERGKNFDKEIIAVNPDGTLQVRHTLLSYDRVNHDGVWKDYVFTDYGNYLEIKTAANILRLDVVTCGFSFHNAENQLLFGDSIIAFNSIVNQYTWNAVTQVNSAACEAYYDVSENSLVAKRYAAGVGYMEYKYIFDNGNWKTQLEATNLTGLTNRVFAFDQTIDLNRDTIKFGGVSRNLDNFNGQSFDRTFLVNNQAKVLEFLNGVNFDFDLGFDYLDSVTITDTGAGKTKLTFHYMRNNEILMPNETLIIDPTFGWSAYSTAKMVFTGAAAAATCQAFTSESSVFPTTLGAGASGAASRCWIHVVEDDFSSITSATSITSVKIRMDTSADTGMVGCDYNALSADIGAQTPAQLATAATTGTALVNDDTTCASNGSNLEVTLGNTANTLLLAEINSGNGIWGIGIVEQDYPTRQAAERTISIGGYEWEVVYDITPPPDAVDDLTSPSQSYGSIDLLWTQPALNGGNLSGYQINYTTPWGNPLTVLTNNTGTSDTSTTVSGLSIATDYTFGVSAWTEIGNNVTNPPMVWLNVTTAGNFTIGSATFNQTNSQVLPITFEEQDINATAKFLNVTFANTYTLACDFSYQFANDNRTYTGLSSYAVSSTLDETYFILTDFEDEIINVNCYDTVTGTDAEYLLVQSDFPLLNQINNFRNGTYGTMGAFGAFDLVTIAVVIFSMIGLNRVNESVGAIFNIILLGSLAYFEIIELPTVIFGVLTVVIIFIITSTRKD